eukprot:Gb_12217 [translate_table: standard]
MVDAMDCMINGGYFSQQTLYPVWQPTELAAVVASNPDKSVDGVNTIVILLTSTTMDIEAGYPATEGSWVVQLPPTLIYLCVYYRWRQGGEWRNSYLLYCSGQFCLSKLLLDLNNITSFLLMNLYSIFALAIKVKSSRGPHGQQ